MTLLVGEDYFPHGDVRAGRVRGALKLSHGRLKARNQAVLAGGASHSQEGDVREQGARVASGFFAREGTIYRGQQQIESTC